MNIIEYGENSLRKIESAIVSVTNKSILHKDFTLIKAKNYVSVDNLRDMMLNDRIIVLGDSDDLKKFLCILEKAPTMTNSNAITIKLLISNEYSMSECIDGLASLITDLKKSENISKIKIHSSKKIEHNFLKVEGSLEIFNDIFYLYELNDKGDN